MRIDKILVPMDFSPTSILALQHAMTLARKTRGRLTLLHVVESATELTSDFPDETLPIQRSHIDQARRMLDALVGPEEWNALDLRTIVKTGDIADEIIATARDQGMDFLVMGAHGRGFFGRSVIGSVTQKILGRLQIPILIVRRLVPVPAFGRILFAIDLSKASSEVLHSVLELAGVTQSKVIAMNAVDVGLEGGAEAAVYLGEQRLKEARVQLNQFKAELSGENLEVEAVLAETSLAATIIRAAEEHHADLIAITASPTGLVAEAIIREAQIPVLSIPVRATATQESAA